MDAAVECLLEQGWTGTTTTEVAKRAGVSRGAQLHHFPTRAELVTHAVKHLADRWIEHFRRAPGALPEGPERVSAVMDLVWSAFSGPLFMAAVELWVASRTDRELHATLLSTEREIGRSVAEFVEGALGGARTREELAGVRRFTMYLMRGMALESILEPKGRGRRRALETWKRIATELLAPPSPRAPA